MNFNTNEIVKENEVLLKAGFTNVVEIISKGEGSITVTPGRIIVDKRLVNDENGGWSAVRVTYKIASISQISIAEHSRENYISLSCLSEGFSSYTEILRVKPTEMNVKNAEAVYSCVSKLIESSR